MTPSKGRGGLMASLALLAVLLPAMGATDAATKTRRNPWSLRLRGEAEVKYDDNILTLSDGDIDSVEDPAPGSNPLETFGIDRPEDLVFTPSFGLTLDRSPRRGRDTAIGITARSNQYAHSTVKDYQEYGVSLRQELNRSRAHRTVLSVSGSRTPRYFLRNLTDEDESQLAGVTIHNPATFEKNRAYIEISQEIVNQVLAVAVGYARERRNYNFHFDERDSSSNVTSLELNLFPAGKIGFRIRPYYEHEEREARGNLPTSSIVDDDVGFDYDLYGIEMRGLWGRDRDHRNNLRCYFEKGTRDFTTTTADPGHFGREDDITKYGLGYTHELGPRWQWGIWAYHRNVDINIFTGKFDRNVVAASFGYNFDHRFEAGDGAREVEA